MWMDDDNFETLNEMEEEEERVTDDDEDWRQPGHVSNLFLKMPQRANQDEIR
jgi:hypothetical protein